MTTMKSFTDLPQSKILSKILRLESADMFYRENGIDAKLIWEHNAHKVKYPCWSLAALLNYLRESDFFPNIEVNEHSITMNVSYYDEKEARPLAPIHNIKVEADTFVDACYEMIIKLHELNLL